jgi:hypothetical protein
VFSILDVTTNKLSRKDGFLRGDWLNSTLAKREDLFCTYKPLYVNIFSWNVGAGVYSPSLRRRAVADFVAA